MWLKEERGREGMNFTSESQSLELCMTNSKERKKQKGPRNFARDGKHLLDLLQQGVHHVRGFTERETWSPNQMGKDYFKLATNRCDIFLKRTNKLTRKESELYTNQIRGFKMRNENGHANRKHSTSSLTSLSSADTDQEATPTISTECLITPVRHFSISKAELNLPVVLKCGQTFRWNQSKLKLDSQSIQQDCVGLDQKPNIQSDPSNFLSELVEWSVAWIDRTIVLRQDDHRIHYVAIYKPSHINQYQIDLELDTTYQLLKTYFVLDVSLVKLYAEWSERDPHFLSKVASGRWDGLRVCRQDGWETMISFICSANNNIPRISLMLNRLCSSFGNPMPQPPLGITLCQRLRHQIIPSDPLSPIELYSFPSPSRLSQPDILEKLKLLGFGYRANYVYKTAVKICEIGMEAERGGRWPGFDTVDSTIKQINGQGFQPETYLKFLANQPYEIAHSKLVSQFPGIGPKVADCICLFGLGFVHVVPVDVHIYKIASRDYQLEITQSTKKTASTAKLQRPSPSSSFSPPIKAKTSSSSKRKKSKQNDDQLDIKAQNPAVPTKNLTLSKHNYSKIQKFLLNLWGPWAGWCQQILFLADLNKPPS